MFVLASASPRRKARLEMLGLKDLRILPAAGEEIAPADAGPGVAVEILSAAKAREIARKCSPDDWIIAADTVVYADEAILGKPADEKEAWSMLRKLSGKMHEVYTGVTIRKGNFSVSEHEVSRVFFRDLSPEEIRAYIATGEPMDKAGAYGIQGIGSLLVERIEGDYFNIVGLPVCRLGKMLKKQGVDLL